MFHRVVLTLCFIPVLAWGASRGGGGGNFQSNLLNAKRSQRTASQWTIADWLTQKRNMKMADQWLALHRSATLFESILSGGHSNYKVKTTNASGVETEVSRESQAYQLDLYFSIFNFFGEFERTSDDREAYGGGAGLRLFGTSSQTTSLLARYGWRKRQDLSAGEVWENQFAEGQLQIYIISQFGLNGTYRHYFPHRSNRGREFAGTRASAGAFVEFMLFRIFGEAYQEPVELTDANGVITKEERRGVTGGVKLYF